MVVLLRRLQIPHSANRKSFRVKLKPKSTEQIEIASRNRLKEGLASKRLCRCCFKSMTLNETQFEVGENSLKALKQISQMRTKRPQRFAQIASPRLNILWNSKTAAFKDRNSLKRLLCGTKQSQTQMHQQLSMKCFVIKKVNELKNQ